MRILSVIAWVTSNILDSAHIPKTCRLLCKWATANLHNGIAGYLRWRGCTWWHAWEDMLQWNNMWKGHLRDIFLRGCKYWFRRWASICGENRFSWKKSANSCDSIWIWPWRTWKQQLITLWFRASWKGLFNKRPHDCSMFTVVRYVRPACAFH